MIIAIINGKGGVGKTTTAIYLATALCKEDYHTVVVDLDQQGSASDWADRAEDAGHPLPFRVEVSNIKRLPRAIAHEPEDTIIILDTPPGDPAVLDTAISVADYVIVPTQASAIEVARVWETLPSLTSVPHGVLITSARLGTSNLDAVRNVMEADGVHVFRSVIPIRESVRKTFGTVPHSLEGYGSVAGELIEEVAS